MDKRDRTQRHISERSRREFLGRATAGLGLVAGLPLFGWRAPIGQPAVAPATTRVWHSGNQLALENGEFRAEWEISKTGLRLVAVQDLRSGRRLAALPPVFSVWLGDGSRIDANGLKLDGEPRTRRLEADHGAARYAARVPGREITATFTAAAGRLEIGWHGILRDGSRYLRQEIELRATGHDVMIREIRLLDLALPGIAAAGTVKGTPVVAGNWFFGFEHPLSETKVAQGRARAFLTRDLPLEAGHRTRFSSVIGCADSGQMRRDFLNYIERERAHPYRTFLHYNSWYDLGFFTPYNQTEAVAAIRAFGEILHVRRGVKISSFLFDDGWDNHKEWGFNAGFPDGFTPLRRAAAAYGAAPGVWLSPWGGYGKPRQERIAWARAHGYETDREGLALAGTKYFARFREVCLRFIHNYGVNQFKLDGTGSPSTTVPDSHFDSDFDAAISLIGDLRAAEPDVFINLTTGTYPSPFWLRWADSTWRGGYDHSFAGVGSERQRWITYRDGATFKHVVRRGALYPLNSLMLHGLIYARYAKGLNSDPYGDFGDEVHSYFGTGTQLQEMYITHSLLSRNNWDTLAEAAKWSRRNAGVLLDAHWMGGDPEKLEPYGWACWSERKAILTMRNPAATRQSFPVDVAQAFQLPDAAAASYEGRSPWRKDATRPPVVLEAGKRHTFTLEPFEVLSLECSPHL